MIRIIPAISHARKAAKATTGSNRCPMPRRPILAFEPPRKGATRAILQLLARCLIMIFMTQPATAAAAAEHRFTASDGAELHYLEAGEDHADALIFIPGWLMPAVIFRDQIAPLATRYRVLILDPRSQGNSPVTGKSHDAERRARDIAEFIAHTRPGRFILAGWSLGVMEGLDYVHRFRPHQLAGLVLIDNSIGEGPAPAPANGPSERELALRDPGRREAYLRHFAESLFARDVPDDLLDAVTDSALKLTGEVALELLNKPYAREYYRDALYRAEVPVLYTILPRLQGQGDALQLRRPDASVEIFAEAGHALFVDEPARFNALLYEFAARSFEEKPR